MIVVLAVAGAMVAFFFALYIERKRHPQVSIRERELQDNRIALAFLFGAMVLGILMLFGP